ncbi:MAG: hypothetical protein HPY89_01310 [Pelotomaculum sp.]|nr:hypothetical protein [Pelotomaculum sp.]
MTVKSINRKGFIFLDLVFSITIFSLVLIPVLNMMLGSTLNSAAAKKTDIAVNLAQMKLEEYRNTGFGELLPVEEKTAFEDHPGFTYTVGLVQDGRISRVVTVTVFFQTASGEKSVALSMERIKR